MEIYYKNKIKSDKEWLTKGRGVIFVEEEKHIETIFKFLVAQDEYFAPYKHLIKVIPKFENNIVDDIFYFSKFLEYSGKTDIYDMDLFFKFCEKNKIKVLLFSNPEPFF